jgi:hypothetical protein
MPKSPLAITLTIVALFFGGGAAGAGAGWWLGRVDWAAAVGGFALPVGFGLSMLAWYGVGVLWILLRLARLLLAGPTARQALLNRPAAEVLNPSGDPSWTVPGTWLFAPLCTVVAAVAGAVIGLGRSASLPGSIAAMALLGFAYGRLMRRAARAGYLIPPEYIE